MKYAAEVFASLPWWKLRPRQDLLVGQPGGDDPAKFVAAGGSDDGDLAMIYLPVGGEVRLKTDRLADGLKAEWFDPRTGKRKMAKDDSGKYRARMNRIGYCCCIRNRSRESFSDASQKRVDKHASAKRR